MNVRRRVVAGVALAVALVLLALLALIMPAGEQQASAVGCADGLVAQPAADVSQTVGGGQVAQARTIIGVGKARNIPARGWVVALAVALQETGLRNLANPLYSETMLLPHDGVGTNLDSVGTFQQRPASGWGTPSQLMDPAYAALAFYGGPDVPPANPGLLDVPDWQSLPVTVAAQMVQRSAFPSAYARWESQATQLAADNSDAPPVTVAGSSGPGIAGSVIPVSATADCATTENVSSSTAASGSAAAVIAQAERWFGTPYSWGGGTLTGPSVGFAQGAGTIGFDCSSYTRIAFSQGAGLSLPRTAAAQFAATAGRTVATGNPNLAQLQPGDLLFWGTSAATIHHVALYVGGGRMDEEAHTGTVAANDAVYDGDFYAATRPLG